MDSILTQSRRGGGLIREIKFLLELKFGVLMREEGIIAGFYDIRGSGGMLLQENF